MKITIQTGDKSYEYSDILTPTTIQNASSSSISTDSSIPEDTKEGFQTSLNAAANQLIDSADSASTSSEKSMDDIFTEASNTYGVDKQFLLAIAKQESNFNPTSTSSSGAMGVMQLMPATAQELGVTDGYDAYQNIMGGAKYISQLLSKYNGDNTLALAAYNAGSGNVAKYNGVPPFASVENYINKVMGYYADSSLSAPDTSYDTTSSQKTQAQELASSLSQFSSHESFDNFIAEVNNELGVSQTDKDHFTSLTYEQLLSTSNQAIVNLLTKMS